MVLLGQELIFQHICIWVKAFKIGARLQQMLKSNLLSLNASAFFWPLLQITLPKWSMLSVGGCLDPLY